MLHKRRFAKNSRKIDQTIHMIRDLIDLANKNDEQAAFIFLDQEKAFDRVNHQFLYKTMKAFGIGDTFINLVKIISSNATSVLINGFLKANSIKKRGEAGMPIECTALRPCN